MKQFLLTEKKITDSVHFLRWGGERKKREKKNKETKEKEQKENNKKTKKNKKEGKNMYKSIKFLLLIILPDFLFIYLFFLVVGGSNK